MLYQCQVGRTMAARDATSGSLSEESSALDLPSVCDIRDYVLQRPSQEANSEAFSSLEFHSLPCSSDVDPGLMYKLQLGPLIYSVLEKETRNDKANQAVT
ncbi:shieldin complex subunit 1 isoform X5 [Chlorocebus sabaeus]|uniref:shieldin complex subunit 1 isoform X5 n=1 Tax=Chlorocebus sabaeus TaxID=60711 RepID=UPI003BF97D81